MLKIYSERQFLPKDVPHCLLLLSFWGDFYETGQYSHFCQEAKNFFKLVAIKNADVAVLPFDGKYLIAKNYFTKEYLVLAKNFVRQAKIKVSKQLFSSTLIQTHIFHCLQKIYGCFGLHSTE
jgi:hypothetical protein